MAKRQQSDWMKPGIGLLISLGGMKNSGANLFLKACVAFIITTKDKRELAVVPIVMSLFQLRSCLVKKFNHVNLKRFTSACRKSSFTCYHSYNLDRLLSLSSE